jgi:uncharacterized membrane protein YraQ (UPF0718 family)
MLRHGQVASNELSGRVDPADARGSNGYARAHMETESIECALPASPDVEARRSTPTIVGVALLVASIAALFLYKWTGSLDVVAQARASGVLKKSPDALLSGGVLLATLRYFQTIWPALAFGVVIGSLAQSAISPRWIAGLLGRRGARSIVAGGLVGAPLMLCSCCVSPVSAGLRARGAGLGAALAVMMGAPGLNVAALFLTFALLPTRLAVARLAGAALLVFGLSALVARRYEATTGAVDHLSPSVRAEEEAPRTLEQLAKRFIRTLATMAATTTPLVFVGVLASSLILPRALTVSALGVTTAVVATALVATLVALPTFFEIPMALLLLGLGAPLGSAAAFLLAGPIVNLPSLFVLGRQTSAKVALSVAAGVWLVATAAGLATSL